MLSDAQFPLFQASVGRHLAGIRGLKGVNAFLREDAGWVEASRLGKTFPDRIEAALQALDPKGGGTVEALPGQQDGWAASYMLAGPGMDLALLLYLDGLNPSELQSQLSQIEAKVGWLMLAALSDRRAEIGGVALGTEIGALVLLDAARARTRKQLADQWIARLEGALSPDLIAVTWLARGKPRLAALSGGGMVDRKSDARSQIEALAAAAVRARTPQLFEPDDGQDPEEGLAAPDGDLPDPEDQREADAARARIEALGASRGMAIPVYAGDEAEAVVIALWSGEAEAGVLHPEAADLVAQVLGESLSIQSRAHPSLLRRMGNWLWNGTRALLGPTAWKLKLFVLMAVVTLAVLASLPSRFEPTFSARIEAQERRVVAAPFDGFLAKAPYQLGDRVAPGDEILAMEDSDLLLQAAQAQSERAEIEAEIQTARALRDSARVQSLEAQARQVDVRRDLLSRQLDLARFEVDRTAVVVGGDAWRRVGGRTRMGEPLLELAAPDKFRVLTFVDEDWVADLAPGASGTLLLTAYPTRPIPVTLTGITTDPQLRDGVNTFSAWMTLSERPQVELLDGMRGVVRVDAGPTSLLGAYTRGLSRWLRRTLWRWGG